MSRKTHSPEKPATPEAKTKKTSSWTKIITSLAIIWTLSSCGNFPNDEFIVNPGTKTEKINVKYKYWGWWSGEPTIIDYNILVSQNWEFYEWHIEQTDWWFKKTKTIRSNDVNNLFQEISTALESGQIEDKTRDNKNDKIACAKEAFIDSVLNNPHPTDREIRIKYKKK